jgi:hypothetical protein
MLDAPDSSRAVAEKAGSAWLMTITNTLFDWPFEGVSPWEMD